LVHNSFIDKTARDEMSELDKVTAHYQEQYKLALFPKLVEALKEAQHFLNFSEKSDSPNMKRIAKLLSKIDSLK
jgi:tRNA uridine 5-carbamoylmethylation protein Kti12